MNNWTVISLFLAQIFLVRFNFVYCELKLTILHTNDCHARIEESTKYGSRCNNETSLKGDCFGGVARRMTAIRRLRAENQNVLLLDGGDQFQGTTWFAVYGGDEAAHFMKLLGYDVMTIGNHEFDHGPAGLGKFLQNATFPVVSANIDASNEPRLNGLFQKSVIVKRDGKKIGIIGYTFHETEFISNPGQNVKFSDEIAAVQAEATSLNNKGVKIIIALGHAGFPRDKEIALKVPEVDVVVGGHTNTFLYTGKPPSIEVPEGDYPFIVTQSSGKKVPVVQDFAFGKYLGVLQLTFNDEGNVIEMGGNPMILDANVTRDPDLLEEVQEWAKKVRDYGEEQVGVSYVYLSADRKNCRRYECNMGNLITDAMVKMSMKPPAADTDRWATSAIALWNSGGFRSSIRKGNVLMNDIVAVLPFRNTISMVDLKGSDLLQALEYSVAQYGEEYISGRFLQVSGLKVVYNVEKPSGSRVVSVETLCNTCSEPVYQPLQPNASYKVLVSDYLLDGGDGHDIIKEKSTNKIELGLVASDLLADYFRKYSPITKGKEGRITFAKGGDDCVSHASDVTSATLFQMLLLICIITYHSFSKVL